MKDIKLCLSCVDFQDCKNASKNKVKSKVIFCSNRNERASK